MSAAADRLRALAKGPALTLPPVRWEAPAEVRRGARWWGGPDAGSEPAVYLGTYETDGTCIDIGAECFTVAQARDLLNRLASAIAMAEEVSR